MITDVGITGEFLKFHAFISGQGVAAWHDVCRDQKTMEWALSLLPETALWLLGLVVGALTLKSSYQSQSFQSSLRQADFCEFKTSLVSIAGVLA